MTCNYPIKFTPHYCDQGLGIGGISEKYLLYGHK